MKSSRAPERASRVCVGIIGLAWAVAAAAHGYQLGALKIGHPWSRETSAGQSIGGGYMKLENTGTDADRLLSASTPAAKSVQLHQMSMQGDVMRMRQLQAVELPAGQTIEFKPGGYHLMLVGLVQPLRAGDSVPLSLHFEKAGSIDVQLKVESASAVQGAASAADHGAMPSDAHEHHH